MILVYIKSFLILFSGLGVFLFGMRTLSESLTTSYANKLSTLFNKVGNNPLKGIAVGGITALVCQSSSTTTVLTVNLADKKTIGTYQATYLIVGANIGTTATAFALCLGALPIVEFFCFLSVVGLIIQASKSTASKRAGQLITSIGLSFIGLYLISSTAKNLVAYEAVSNFLLNNERPLSCLVYGLLFTAVIQSSSATNGLIIIALANNMLTLENALMIMTGANIGTCFTALLASIKKSKNAMYASFIHLAFNLLSALLFVPFIIVPDSILYAILKGSAQFKAATFNLLINVVTGLVFLAFSPIIKPKKLVNVADSGNSIHRIEQN